MNIKKYDDQNNNKAATLSYRLPTPLTLEEIEDGISIESQLADKNTMIKALEYLKKTMGQEKLSYPLD